MSETRKKRKQKELIQWIASLIIVVAIAFIIRTFVVCPVMVKGISMEPNFHHGDIVLVNRLEYRFSEPKKDDIVIVKSPVGMPGRAIRNDFVKAHETEKEKITHCFACLEGCNPADTPYCITMALIRAVRSNNEYDTSLVFCGENAYKVDKITTVKEIFDELTAE